MNVEAENMTYEQWSKVIDINLNGVFLCATAAGRQMLKQGLWFNHQYSIYVRTHCKCSSATRVAYNASKAGVIMLTKSLAIEWAKKGVRKLHQPLDISEQT